ncbi:hypothetical protein EDD85DRAFT_941477 [Armillaria nabsnona]|nr:hypothetical protein EDD85DRAFT_943270 [Armillaria nabsnona]KAK0222541.1 hypothetical protein EDD85DRAFT_941477 [Armillaria nabsnona]
MLISVPLLAITIPLVYLLLGFVSIEPVARRRFLLVSEELEQRRDGATLLVPSQFSNSTMACHVRAVDPAVPDWNLVPVYIHTTHHLELQDFDLLERRDPTPIVIGLLHTE